MFCVLIIVGVIPEIANSYIAWNPPAPSKEKLLNLLWITPMVIAGPANVSVVKVEGSTLVNEYSRSEVMVSSSVTAGNGISIDPSVSIAGAKGFKVDLSYYYEIGWSFSWDSVRNAVGVGSSSAAPPAPPKK
jgi:hypothetical protein